MSLFFKKTVPFFVAIFLNILFFSCLKAQKNTVTLQLVIDSATQHLPILLEKKAFISSAEASINDATHQRLPTVKFLEEISAASSNNVAGVYFPMGTIPSVSGSIRSNNNFKPELGNVGMLYGEYDLIDFGLSKARINAAKSYLNLVKSDFDRQLYLLKWQTSITYFNLLRTEYQLSIDRQNITRYNEIYKIIRTLTLNGLRPGVDSSQLMAEMSKTRMTYNTTSGKIYDLQQQLNFYSGINLQNLLIDSSVAVSSFPNSSVYDTSFILSNSPFINYFRIQSDYYRKNLLLIQKSYQPRIVLLGGLWGRGSSIAYSDQYKGIINGLGYQRYNYATAISFVYNLFDAVHRRDKLSVYNFRIQASDLELKEQIEELNNSVGQDNTVIQTAEKNLAEIPIQLQSAKDAYNQKLAQYNAGIINLIDLTNASYILYRAQTDYVQLWNDWFLAILNKAAITGNLDQFIQSIKK